MLAEFARWKAKQSARSERENAAHSSLSRRIVKQKAAPEYWEIEKAASAFEMAPSAPAEPAGFGAQPSRIENSGSFFGIGRPVIVTPYLISPDVITRRNKKQ
jgi:hypothetical protein